MNSAAGWGKIASLIPSGEGARHTSRIFLVEDDRGIAEAIAAQTALWDMETVCARDFRNVMAEFSACAPQLVLLDVSLPFYDGYHWCREIRSVSNVPVIFIEDVIFPHTLFDQEIRKEVEDKNFEQKALFNRLKKQGEKGIYYIPAAKMTEPDGESTADTIHLTDLGMQRYVDLVLPVIRKALRKAKK